MGSKRDEYIRRGYPTILIGNAPALNQSSKLMCAYGGVIQITNPGTTNIQIP